MKIAVHFSYVAYPRLYLATLSDRDVRLTPHRADAATFDDVATATAAVSQLRARLDDDEIFVLPVGGG